MIAFIASVFKVGWCLMSSSMAVPRLDAVSPARNFKKSKINKER